jgi:hypothetical protein
MIGICRSIEEMAGWGIIERLLLIWPDFVVLLTANEQLIEPSLILTLNVKLGTLTAQ